MENPAWTGGDGYDAFDLGIPGILSKRCFSHLSNPEPSQPQSISSVFGPLAEPTLTRETDLDSLNLESLRSRCGEESKRYFQRKEHDPRFCFEIFRRAILDQDGEAWECVYRQYQPLVAGWVERHSQFHLLDEDKDYFVNLAFEKMWASVTPSKFARFADLNALLGYLKMCVGSAIIDHGRMLARRKLEELVEQADTEIQDDLPSAEEQVINRFQYQELWNQVKALISDPKEYHVLYGSFVLDLKPREIVENYPEDFKTVRDVYRVKENLLERLRRNRELADSFLRYAEQIS